MRLAEILRESSDPILTFIASHSNKELSSGNCGVFAIAVNEKFNVDSFIYVENEAEPDRLYHVAVVKDNVIYDGNGITTKDRLRLYGVDDDFPENDPILNKVPASESEYRFIMQGTEPTITVSDLTQGLL
jgi:hypothetical protein